MSGDLGLGFVQGTEADVLNDLTVDVARLGNTGPTGAVGPTGAASVVTGPTGAASVVTGPTGAVGPTGPLSAGPNYISLRRDIQGASTYEVEDGAPIPFDYIFSVGPWAEVSGATGATVTVSGNYIIRTDFDTTAPTGPTGPFDDGTIDLYQDGVYLSEAIGSIALAVTAPSTFSLINTQGTSVTLWSASLFIEQA